MGPHHRVHRAILATVLVAMVAVGCSSDEGGGSATSPSSTTPPPPPAPGTVTLDVSGVTDATGLVMLAVIGNNVPEQMMGAVCDIVSADPFTFIGQYLPLTGGDPCTLGTEPIKFQPGSYEVLVAVMPGGATTPQQCTETNVTVDGDVTVEVTSLGPPSDCDF